MKENINVGRPVASQERALLKRQNSFSVSVTYLHLPSLVESDLHNDNLVTRLFDNGGAFAGGGFSGSRLLEDLGDPKLGELFYSDAMPSQKEIERKS